MFSLGLFLVTLGIPSVHSQTLPAETIPEDFLICITQESEPTDSDLCFDPRRVDEISDLKITIPNQGDLLLRGSLLVQGSQVATFGALLLMPPSITKWQENPLKFAGQHLRRAWSNPPVWDHDEWYINYIGHPYSGSLYYNAIRSQGASPFTAFLFSTGESLLWEYGLEATAEQPSVQDLLFTSTIGSVMGELSHRATLKMSRNGFKTIEKIAVIVINPMYAINQGFKKRRR